MKLRLSVAAAALLASLLLLAPLAASVGAYTGVGPSWRSNGSDKCHETVSLTLYPSPLRPGLWAAEIACVYAWPYNAASLEYGVSQWPSHVMNELVGSPETGFTDSGTANVHGTSPGTVDWTFTIGPLGDDTAWSIDTVFHPDPDPFGTGPRTSWWRGSADFVGASG